MLICFCRLAPPKRRHGVHDRPAVPARVLLGGVQGGAETQDAGTDDDLQLHGKALTNRHKDNKSDVCIPFVSTRPYARAALLRSVERVLLCG